MSPGETYETLRIGIHGGIARVTIDRPPINMPRATIGVVEAWRSATAT